MSTRDSALVALGEAVKFESDGRDFYLQAAAAARNPLARAVFAALAEDENGHVKRVREIYEELKDKPGWPAVSSMVARASGVVDAFERASADIQKAVPPDSPAVPALEKAADLERQGLAFYREREAKATCAAESEFFRLLVTEEEEHLAAIEGLLGALS